MILIRVPSIRCFRKTPLDIVWDDIYHATSMGWPCGAVTFNYFAMDCRKFGRDDLSIVERTRRFHFWGLLIDRVLAVGGLCLVTIAFDWLVRRRAAQKRA